MDEIDDESDCTDVPENPGPQRAVVGDDDDGPVAECSDDP